ncbi:MAG TPA: MFS transporter [Terriglobales bacterium]|nr:MFS transporter [Terriglobales bacterium]
MALPAVETLPTFRYRSALFLLHIGFLLTGIVNALLGPLLPILQTRFHASDSELGALFAAQFAGASLGGLVSQWRPRLSIIGGFVLIAGGLLTLAVSSWAVVAPAVFAFGFGLGAAIPATNMTVAYAAKDRRASSLNILNLVWGAGAAGSALIVAALMRWLGFPGMLFTISLAAAAVVLALLIVRVPATFPEKQHGAESTGAAGKLLLYCFLLFLYIGVEGCIGGWSGKYAATLSNRHFYVTLSLVSFWTALLAGRAIAALLLRHTGEVVLFRASLLATAAGLAVFFIARSGTAVVLAALIAGLGLAPLFALLLSLMSRYAEATSVTIPGWLFSLGSMGGGALPWLFGAVTTLSGSLRVAMIVPAIGTLLLTFFVLLETAGEAKCQAPATRS